jgi:hypothetical protein
MGLFYGHDRSCHFCKAGYGRAMLTLVAIALCLAAPPENTRYARGQELVYRGQCVEAITGDNAGPQHTFDLTTRLFVLEPGPELAVATTVTNKDGSVSTRFGVIKPGAAPFAIALDRPASLDPVVILDLPTGPLEVGATWATNDGRRPPRGWKVEAAESPPQGGGRCWKLRGHQQTTNWEQPDGGKAWRREDVAWIDTRTHIVQRLERVLTVRDPSQPNDLRRIITCFQLEGNMVYPGALEAEVRAEVLAARQAFDKLAEQPDARSLDMQARRLANHLRQQSKTEWRHVVLAAEKQIEAARRGEIVAVAAEEEAKPEWVIGKLAPDFVAIETGQGSIQLSQCRGRPVVIGVYREKTAVGKETRQTLVDTFVAAKGHAAVVAVCFNHPMPVLPITADYKPVGWSHPGLIECDVSNHDQLFDGTTPRFILIDERGIVRQIIEGYGAEVPSLLRQFVESAGPVKAAGRAEFDERK